MAVAVLALACLSCRARSLRATCAENFGQGDYAAALPSCEKSYANTKSNEDLYKVAVATLKMSSCPAGRPLLEAIPEDVHFVDVQLYLAYCDIRGDDQKEKGLQRVRLAMARAEDDKYAEGIAKANTLLSQVYLSEASFDLALETANKALQIVLRDAQHFHPDTPLNVYLQLLDLHCRMKDYGTAGAIIAQFEGYKGTMPRRALGWMLHREATYREEQGEHDYAKELLEKLHDLHVRDARLQSQYEHYIPWLYYHLGDYAEAARRAATLKAPFEAQLLMAYVAAAQGKLQEAEAHLKKAGDEEPPDEDFRWEQARATAEVAELLGNHEAAEQYYRHAIGYISSLRLAAPASVPFFVASHRGPFEGLIALLAEQGRWKEALKVALLLDASNLSQVSAAPQGPERISPSNAYILPDAAKSDPFLAADAAVEEVIARWREKGTLIIAVAPGSRIVGPVERRPRRAYRIIVKDGEVTGSVIAGFAKDPKDAEDAEALAELSVQLGGDPSKEQEGKRLAAAIIPDVESAEPLIVLGVGRLAKLPLAGLRNAKGELLVGRRSLQKAVSLREGREAPKYSEVSVVIAANPAAEPNEVMPAAKFQDDAEAAFKALVAASSPERVKRFGLGTAKPATRERLWEAKNADVFYLAAHIVDRDRQKAIRLDAPNGVAPDDVVARELAEAGMAPRIAILASCGSGVASDEAGMGSVAAAFSKAGTDIIIATDRDVNDGQTQVFMSAVLGQPDWKRAPALALGRMQQAAKNGPIDGVEIDVQVWGAFMVITRAPYVPAPQTASLRQP